MVTDISTFVNGSRARADARSTLHDSRDDPYQLDRNPYGWASCFDDLSLLGPRSPGVNKRRHPRPPRGPKRRAYRRRVRRSFSTWRPPIHEWRGILPTPPRQSRCPDERFGLSRRNKRDKRTYPYYPPCGQWRCACKIYDLVGYQAQVLRIFRRLPRVFVTVYPVSLAKGDKASRDLRKRIAKRLKHRSATDGRDRGYLRFTLTDGREFALATHDITGDLEPTHGFWTSGVAAADLASWLCDRFLQAKPQGAVWALKDAKKPRNPDAETIGDLPVRRKQRNLLRDFVAERTGFDVLSLDVLPDSRVHEVRDAMKEEYEMIKVFGLGLDPDRN